MRGERRRHMQGGQLRCVLDDAVWQMNLQTFPLPKLVGHGHGHGLGHRYVRKRESKRRRKLAHRVAKRVGRGQGMLTLI